VIAQVYAFLCSQRNDPIELTQQELKQALRLSIGTEGVGTCERLLAACGVLERMEPNRNMAAVRIESDLPTLVDLVPAPAHTRRRVIRAVESLVGQRRYELVYFRLHDVAETAELPLASVSRALRELTHLDVFDYVPPFRGRAIHMLRRDVPFERLEIDYQELEERRGSSLGKLDRMIRFAQTSRCRQLEILHYFGEATNDACGNCDNCGAGRGAHSAGSVTSGALDNGLDNGLVEIARMVLSGVARGRGRFGKQVLTAMLCGSRSAKIAKWKLDQLSTFGLLSEFTQSEVSLLIEALGKAACLEQSGIDRFRPVISVTNLGLEVMRRRAPAPSSLAIPPKLEAKVRRFGARWQARMRRQSLAVGSRSPGSDPAGEGPRSTGFDGGMQPQAKPSHFWTWLLLRDGYTPDQCAGIRQIELPQLLRHLIEAVEDGLSVELGWVLSEDQIRELEKTVGQCFSPTAPPADLAGGLVAEHLQLFLKCRDRSRRTTSPA
jgi:ATP-dependent DNA helicase RecQ